MKCLKRSGPKHSQPNRTINFINLCSLIFSGCKMLKTTPDELAGRLLISLIESYVTEEQNREFVKRTEGIPFYGMSVEPYWVEFMAELVKDRETHISAQISYPLGQQTLDTKLEQIKYCKDRGAGEVDVAANYTAELSGDFEALKNEVEEIVDAAGDMRCVILPQLCLMNDEKKIEVVRTIVEAGADGIKTNSGWVDYHSRVETVELIRKELGYDFDIDASSGVRTKEQAEEFFVAGADNIHSSSPHIMVDEWKDIDSSKILKDIPGVP